MEKNSKVSKKVDSKELLKQIESGEKISNKELGALLKELKANPENEITAEYLKIEVGQSVRLYFIDMTTIKSLREGAPDDERSPAARFVDEDGLFIINADVVVVSTCSKLTRPTPVELICTGEKGPKSRTYKTFRITQLD